MRKIFFSLLFAWAFVACIKQDENPTPVDNTAEKVNYSKPTGNTLMLNQRLIGDTTKSNTIHRMLDAGDGGFYFVGLQENNYVVGKVSASGTYLWTQKVGFEINSLALTKTSSVSGSERLVICGKNIVSFFTLNGTFDKDIYVNQPSNITLNDLKSYGTGMYVIGSTEKNGVSYPIHGFVPYNPTSSSTMVIKTMDNLAGFEFGSFSKNYGYVEPKPNDNPRPGGNGDYDTSGSSGGDKDGGTVTSGSGGNEGSYFFECFARQLNKERISQKATVFNIDAAKNQIIWQRDLVIGSGFKSGSRVGNGVLAEKNGLLYAVGYTEQSKKENPDGGGYWNSGLIACVKASDGSLVWQKTHSLSERDDRFNRIFITSNNEIFVSGYASTYFRSKSNKAFGYGLLAKINPSNGEIISHKTFGEESKYSSFNHLYVKDNQFFAVGFANQNYSTSGFQAWFVELNKSF